MLAIKEPSEATFTSIEVLLLYTLSSNGAGPQFTPPSVETFRPCEVEAYTMFAFEGSAAILKTNVKASFPSVGSVAVNLVKVFPLSVDFQIPEPNIIGVAVFKP